MPRTLLMAVKSSFRNSKGAGCGRGVPGGVSLPCGRRCPLPAVEGFGEGAIPLPGTIFYLTSK